MIPAENYKKICRKRRRCQGRPQYEVEVVRMKVSEEAVEAI